MKLSHFYHIYADGNWQEPVAEHIRALKESGLINELTTFHIGMVGNAGNVAAVHHYIQSQGVHYHKWWAEETGWEQVTQIKLWEFAQDNDGLILYAHSKGSSNGMDVNVRWRRSMIWHNVINWKFAVEKLQTHDAYGCHWIRPLIDGSMPEHVLGNFMFAGTFWWSKCEVVRTWIRPPLTHRHEAEGWIGYGWHANPFPVYDPTPYFPNAGPFADQWATGIGQIDKWEGKSYPI